MFVSWKNTFTKSKIYWQDGWGLGCAADFSSLQELKEFIDLTHIRYGLVKPYFEHPSYPLVEPRDLLPSFESDLLEYKQLPGFSMVVFDRPLNYFQEVFQFDRLRLLEHEQPEAKAAAALAHNMNALQNRLHKALHEPLRGRFTGLDLTALENYPALFPYLCQMDRGQVMALHKDHAGQMRYHLQGVYASFPSDLDTEIKRYGLRIGKFAVGDNELYEQNRLFVYQHLMELYGFPIASERRTSAALFARRLHKMGERFLIRTLGQSDRVITSIWHDGGERAYPYVEKLALVALEPQQKELVQFCAENGYFLDEEKRVVILRVTYRQHKFSADNLRQERALSVEQQELVHPLTAERRVIDIIKDSGNMSLHLTDIVRGEYTGRIIYKRTELIENTDTVEKRLKFLAAWLAKHQRRMIGYSEEFFANLTKVLDNYLFSPENYADFLTYEDIYTEVRSRYNYIRQARRIRVLEDLQHRQFKGKRISYNCMMQECVSLMSELKFEVVNYFDVLVVNAIKVGENILNDRYLRKTYIENFKEDLTAAGMEIRKNYGLLAGLVDDFKAIRKMRVAGTAD